MKLRGQEMSVVSLDPKNYFVSIVLVLSAVSFMGVSDAQLRVGFYSKTCPAAESTVRAVVQRAVAADSRAAAILLRLHFHDCFVEGCDASILIRHDGDETGAGGNAGVGGFEIVDDIKTELERACPRIVSCADVVALAARDAVVLKKGPSYEVPTGRRDGRVSTVDQAARLPEDRDPIDVLKSKFREKGLSDQDLVLLTAGAHTIGQTACAFVTSRLYNFTAAGGPDPTLNSQLVPELKAKCPFGGDNAVKVSLDWGSDQVFDNHIFRNIKNGFGVIASDAALYRDRSTREILNTYIAGNRGAARANFPADFARAMVKMGNIGVKTGSEGEIRRVCSATN